MAGLSGRHEQLEATRWFDALGRSLDHSWGGHSNDDSHPWGDGGSPQWQGEWSLRGTVDGRPIEIGSAGHGEIVARVGTRVPLPHFLQGRRWLNQRGVVRMVAGPNWVETWLHARSATEIPALLEQALERAVSTEQLVLGRWRARAMAHGLSFEQAPEPSTAFRIGGHGSWGTLDLCAGIELDELVLRVEATASPGSSATRARDLLEQLGPADGGDDHWSIPLGAPARIEAEVVLNALRDAIVQLR